MASQNTIIHLVERDVFPRQAVVTALQGNEVIPDRRGDKPLVPHLLVFPVAALQPIFVTLTNRDRTAHSTAIISNITSRIE